jgi:hypothetical protein
MPNKQEITSDLLRGNSLALDIADTIFSDLNSFDVSAQDKDK